MERSGRADADAGRLQSILQSVQAEIAFLHLSIPAKLRDAKRTNHQTHSAPDTKLLIH
jgi:hypothetical protein